MCKGPPGHWAVFEALEVALRSSARVTILNTKAIRMGLARGFTTAQPHKRLYPTLLPNPVLH